MPAGARERQPRDAVGGDVGRVALVLEVGAEAVGEIAVVLHDQDPGHGTPTAPARRPASERASTRVASGSSTTNREPPPSANSTRHSPAWAATSSRTTARPIPLPGTSPRGRRRTNGPRS